MEFKEEFIQENGLTTEQVNALTEATTAHEASLKQDTWEKEWSATANKQAEGILNGAGQKVITLTGISRDEGEKWADYLSRANNLYFEGTRTSLERKEKDLDEKIKKGGGDETLKAELITTKEALQTLKEKEAKFADWEENNYKEKYSEATQELSKLKLNIAFNSVKPNFPDTVNSFEAKAKWSEFQKTTQDKYNIVLDENNEPWGASKTNDLIRVKLSDLVEKDEAITALTQGRQQKGTGAIPKGNVQLEGVPFEVPKNATATERQKAVKEYLASQNIPKTSEEYSKKFAELNAKILEKNPAK